MKTGLEDYVSHFLIADYAVAVVSLVLASLLPLVVLHPILHPPLLHFLVHFPNELYSRDYEQAGKQEVDQQQSSLLCEYSRLNVPLLLRYVVWVSANDLA